MKTQARIEKPIHWGKKDILKFQVYASNFSMNFPPQHLKFLFHLLFSLHKPVFTTQRMQDFCIGNRVLRQCLYYFRFHTYFYEGTRFLAWAKQSLSSPCMSLFPQPDDGAHTFLFLIFSITYIKISTEAVITSLPNHQIVMSVMCPPFPEPAVPHASAAQALCQSSLSTPGVESGELAILFI